jgi:acyl-CoA reductase-like NAD-dependent aldehyde dehydrogenase
LQNVSVSYEGDWSVPMTDAPKLIVERPYDGAFIDELPYATWPDADAMLARATAAFENRDGWLPAYKRIEVLRRLASLMRDRTEDFALLIASEGGKPLTDARIEAARAVNGVELAAEGIAGLHGQEMPQRVQPPAQPDRPSSRPGDRHRLPGHCQTRRYDAFVMPEICRSGP